MPRKSAQKRKRPSKRRSKKTQGLKKAFLLSSILIISSAFLVGYGFYKKFTSQFASAFSPSTYNILTEEIYTAAFVAVEDFEASPLKVESIYLFVLDKSTQKLIRYNVPLEVEIDVPGRFGIEPFSNIPALGNLDDSMSESAELISRALFKLMAFPVDRYLVVESDMSDLLVNLLEGALSLPDNDTELLALKDKVKTNMSFRELLDSYSFSSTLPRDRVIRKDYSDSYAENHLLLDEEFMDITFDSAFSNEKKSVAILNGSGAPGIASFSARVVKNIGGRVVAVGNTATSYEKSVIIADDLTTESTRILKNIFDIEEIVLDSEAREFDESEISRSDVTIILGIDFANTL